ncbi:hypothetical protein AVEN_194657-1 [Araneus ventricosus]|uniref:Uncharacterized protein n=1 Tax=Araneus ventricosus TaxID=182803 RepID=A0A4Y2A6W8_ARAVE|nr:hypothetical protein AVEN_194657-1 [Araneus ventricosus]
MFSYRLPNFQYGSIPASEFPTQQYALQPQPYPPQCQYYPSELSTIHRSLSSVPLRFDRIHQSRHYVPPSPSVRDCNPAALSDFVSYLNPHSVQDQQSRTRLFLTISSSHPESVNTLSNISGTSFLDNAVE